ncbi:MAG: glycerophosphodiester phosphodiesterase [Burkholderiaceae bacterium]|nr:glycerophosphodiester phosphodiesterase [Microbacteriaceae bacterium]
MSPRLQRMSAPTACLAVASTAALLIGLAAVPAAAVPMPTALTTVIPAGEELTIPLVAPGDSAQVIAHRGNSSVAPENTLPAIVSAQRGGADWIEVDIDYTADGVPVLLHDNTVDRTTDGTGDIRDLDYEYVSALDAGSWFDEGYAGAAVPTLEAALDWVADSDARLLLEYKNTWSPEMVQLTAAMIADAGLNDRIITMSFSAETTGLLQEFAPDVERMILSSAIPIDPVAYARQFGALGISVSGRAVLTTPGVVEEMNAEDLVVLTWTINDAETWEQLTELGVEGITSDRPDRLVGWNEKHSSSDGGTDGNEPVLPIDGVLPALPTLPVL